MKTTIKTIGLLLFVAIAQIAFGQNSNDKLDKAIELMDNGQVDESIAILEDARKLEPKNFYYSYELAYAYYLKMDYNAVIKVLKKVKNHKDVSDRFFQLLGNSYDNINKTDKAIKIYENGLKKFPKSGNLYLELGIIQINKKNDNAALAYFEKGIEVAPTAASNYYWAAKIFLNSTEEVWGMIYGEIFMNLERNSKRTEEISKLLFDTYKSEIKFTSENSFSVSFSKNANFNLNNFKLPFGVGVYEPTLMMSMLKIKTIDINTLDTIRTNFIDTYFDNGKDKNYPNVLFSYQKQVKDAGHIESYNHWILMKGDEDMFGIWFDSNKEKWDAFVEWFQKNPIKINDSNKFYRGQY
ncbi:MAG: tetratricopeptide repeat protein [Paludibacter sp.]|jgi:tetratricopeptide (TPR) repeat protein|nr:tetratricopeptide repeat protein [Paludibacter sp.]